VVARALGEAHHLVLHRRAIAGSHPLDAPGEERRAVEPGADDLVGALGGARDPAGDLAGVLRGAPEEGEDGHRVVPRLEGEPREVHRACVDPRRGAGLQTLDPERHLPQTAGECGGRRVTRAPAGVARESHVDLAREEGAHGEHHAGGVEAQANLRDHPGHAVARDDQVVHRLLEQGEARLGLDGPADLALVELAVDLGPRRPHGRPLARVQGPELDPGAVGGAPHEPPEGIHLAHEMTLADPADGGVAAHLAQGLDVVGEQQRPRPGPGRGERSLGAGVSAADHDDLEGVRVSQRKQRLEGSRAPPDGRLGVGPIFPRIGPPPQPAPS